MMSSRNREEGFVVLKDGAELPFTKTKSSPLNVLVAHGLGSDPAAKSHENDISYDIWSDCCRILTTDTDASSSSSSPDEQQIQRTGIYYTARGHGNSRGWDRQAKTKVTTTSTDDDKVLAEPFTWPALAKDMFRVADQTGLDKIKFTVFAQSMGAATALYGAMSKEGKERINALVLARPPRIWESRQECAKDGYELAAATYKEHNPGSYRYLPLLGAALTDLPNRNDNAYRNINIPVLILSHGQDENHPILSGQQLSEVMPHSTFHQLASNEEEARIIWPKVIAEWLVQQGLVEGQSNK